MKTKVDNSPPMKPRKRGLIYQYYRVWAELVEIRKHHTSRLKAIEAGKSSLDPNLEELILSELSIDKWIKVYKKNMIEASKLLAPDIHHWLASIRGIGDKTAAALIGELDDSARFDNISKLWRFAGYAVVDGRRERLVKGQPAHFNRRLKSLVYMIGNSFIKKQTPVYVDIYYREKARQRELHPEAYKENGKWLYNDGHLHNRAIGKMVKMFLSHVWLVWRTAEGLSVTQPYAMSILGHDGFVPPPMPEGDTAVAVDDDNDDDLFEDEEDE